MTFIDSHCHLPNMRHKDALERILIDAGNWNVTQFINIGTSIKENAEAVEVARNYPAIFATVGIYPHEHRGENIDALIKRLAEQAKSSTKVVAIGECGIDNTGWQAQRPLEEQIALFDLQVQVAQELSLPIIIHNRNGDELIGDVLSKYQSLKGVIHCFDSTWQVAQKFLNLGLYLSFSGFVTYESHHNLVKVAKNVPSDRYLLETDSPYLLPEPAKSEADTNSGKRKNEPKYVRMVGQKVAEIKQLSLETVALQSRENTRKLFGI